VFVLDPEAGPGAVQAAVYGALSGGDGFRVQVRGAAAAYSFYLAWDGLALDHRIWQ
jgi:hypothetical protein